MLTISQLTIAGPVALDPVRRVVLRDNVIDAARRLRKARADWDLGCPDGLAPKYLALTVALDALDAAEGWT